MRYANDPVTIVPICQNHTDASNRYAFVPHVVPSNAIWQFEFDEQTGRLTPNATP